MRPPRKGSLCMETVVGPKSGFKIPAWVKRTVPVIVSAFILYYYFRDMKWAEFFEACQRADIALAVAAIVIPQVVFWFFTTLVVERTMTWFHAPFPFWEYFWIRGAIYILMFVNTAVGGGGLLLYQQRRGRISWRKLMGMFLFRAGVGVGWGMMFVMIPITLAMHYYGFADKIRINMYVWWGILIFPGLLFFISSWYYWFYDKGTFGLHKLIVRDRYSEFWSTFNQADRGHWVKTWAMSVPPVVIMFVGLYFLNRAFNINAPFLECMVVMPVALLLMDLPIAFSGFGTTTLAWMTLFGNYGEAADIAALSLFLPSARLLCRAAIGGVSLLPALRSLGNIPRADSMEAENVPEMAANQ